MDSLSNISFGPLLTVTLTLLAVIDILGSVPVLISLKNKMGDIHAGTATGVSGLLMLLFLIVGDKVLSLMGIDVSSFAIAGSIVIFILALEMVLGHDLFRADTSHSLRQYCAHRFPHYRGQRNTHDHHVTTHEHSCLQHHPRHPY